MARIPTEKHYSHKERPLDRWINLANLLPPQEAIPDPSAMVAIPVPISAKAGASTRQLAKRRKQKKRRQPGWVRALEASPTLHDAIRKVDKAWKERLTTLPRFDSSADLAADRYGIFYRVRETLRDIVREISAPYFKRPAGQHETWLGTRQNETWLAGGEIRTFETRPRKIGLVGRGIMVSEDSYGVFLDVLEQVGDEIYSLKFCPVCDAIFQPRRKDQRACAPRCANVLRVREQRKYEESRQRTKERVLRKRRTAR